MKTLSEICGIIGPEQAVYDALNRKWHRKGDELVPGKPLETLSNVDTVLRDDSRWNGRIRWNEFSKSVELNNDLISDAELTRTRLWVERVYGLASSEARMIRVCQSIARDYAYHPVRDYLHRVGKEWDGNARISFFLEDCFGADAGGDTAADDDPHRVVRSISRCFFLSAVARTMQPGCKVDTVLVLVSPRQGTHKSQGLEALCPNPGWFSDSALDIGDKDALAQIHSAVWIQELSEMDSLRKKEMSKVKAFISSRKDKYRPHYGRCVVEYGRQLVFVASTNRLQFLRDPTGSRRFWPVRTTGLANLERIRHDRDQLWAEAVRAYQAREQWHLTRDDEVRLAELSEQFQALDPWHASVVDWLASTTKGFFTTADVLMGLQVPVDRRNRSHQNRVSSILSALGCQPTRKRFGGPKVRGWVRGVGR